MEEHLEFLFLAERDATKALIQSAIASRGDQGYSGGSKNKMMKVAHSKGKKVSRLKDPGTQPSPLTPNSRPHPGGSMPNSRPHPGPSTPNQGSSTNPSMPTTNRGIPSEPTTSREGEAIAESHVTGDAFQTNIKKSET